MDDYICPISDALRRTDPKTRKRDRILSDDEIRDLAAARRSRDLWVALLTAQRLEKIVTMKSASLSDDGIWTVPHAHREKARRRSPCVARTGPANDPHATAATTGNLNVNVKTFVFGLNGQVNGGVYVQADGVDAKKTNGCRLLPPSFELH